MILNWFRPLKIQSIRRQVLFPNNNPQMVMYIETTGIGAIIINQTKRICLGKRRCRFITDNKWQTINLIHFFGTQQFSIAPININHHARIKTTTPKQLKQSALPSIKPIKLNRTVKISFKLRANQFSVKSYKTRIQIKNLRFKIVNNFQRGQCI